MEQGLLVDTEVRECGWDESANRPAPGTLRNPLANPKAAACWPTGPGSGLFSPTTTRSTSAPTGRTEAGSPLLGPTPGTSSRLNRGRPPASGMADEYTVGVSPNLILIRDAVARELYAQLPLRNQAIGQKDIPGVAYALAVLLDRMRVLNDPH